MSENPKSSALRPDGAKQSRRGNASDRAWGKLPNDIAKNPRVPDVALVLLAYLSTFVGKWVLNWRDVSGICTSGLKERAFWRALRILRTLGLIIRVITPVPGKQGRGRVIEDILALPNYGENYRRVERAWFRWVMTMKALALLLFIRACGPVGVKPWQVEKRFDWSLPTVKKYADELIAAGLIENRGAKQAPLYVEANSKKAQFKKPQYKNLRSKKTQSLHSVTSLHNVSPLHTEEPLQRETGEAE